MKAGGSLKIIIAIIIFSIIILIHEFGHFLLAKKNGICVTEFCLGMGPTLFGFTKGETKYSVKLLPFGGACMMLGEDEAVEDERSFGSKSVWARISVVIAGPLFNFLLAFLLSLFVVGSIGYDAPVIGEVIDGYPAKEAGLMAGDKIIKMGDENIRVYREISLYNQYNESQTIDIVFERDGERHTVTLSNKQDESGRYLFGFAKGGARQKGNVLDVIKYSVYEVRFWIKTTIKSLGMIFKGRVSMYDLSGPVGIVNVIGDTYEKSVPSGAFIVSINMLNIAILLTANVGVMNLLPIPALDGGRLLFLIIELIRGKRFNQEKEGMVNFVGLILLMLLMFAIMINDIKNLFV